MDDPERILNDVIGVLVLSVPIILLTMWLLPAPYSHAIYGSWAVIGVSIIGIALLEEREAERTRPESKCSCPCVCGAGDDDGDGDGGGAGDADDVPPESVEYEYVDAGHGRDEWPPVGQRDDDRGGRK